MQPKKPNPLSLCVSMVSGMGALLMVSLGLGTTAAAEEPAWYTVELIVFENTHPRAIESETWQENPGGPDLQGVLELSTRRNAPKRRGVLGSGDAFRLLRADDRKLGGVARSMASSLEFRPILHVAWRQPGHKKEEAKGVHVRSNLPNPYRSLTGSALIGRSAVGAGGTFSPEDSATNTATTLYESANPRKPFVDGTVQLYATRYLHLLVDLVYYRPPTGALRGIPSAPSPSLPDGVAPDSPATSYLRALPTPSLFRVKERRRLRSGELNYFDHPMFGMLVQVSPYEQSLPQETAREESAPQGEPSPEVGSLNQPSAPQTGTPALNPPATKPNN